MNMADMRANCEGHTRQGRARAVRDAGKPALREGTRDGSGELLAALHTLG